MAGYFIKAVNSEDYRVKVLVERTHCMVKDGKDGSLKGNLADRMVQLFV